MTMGPESSGCRSRKASTAAPGAGRPICPDTSSVKKSQTSMNLSTVSRVTWSASTK